MVKNKYSRSRLNVGVSRRSRLNESLRTVMSDFNSIESKVDDDLVGEVYEELRYTLKIADEQFGQLFRKVKSFLVNPEGYLGNLDDVDYKADQIIKWAVKLRKVLNEVNNL